MFAYSGLNKERRAPVIAGYQQHNDDKQGNKKDEPETGDHDIKNSFQGQRRRRAVLYRVKHWT